MLHHCLFSLNGIFISGGRDNVYDYSNKSGEISSLTARFDLRVLIDAICALRMMDLSVLADMFAVAFFCRLAIKVPTKLFKRFG